MHQRFFMALLLLSALLLIGCTSASQPPPPTQPPAQPPVTPPGPPPRVQTIDDELADRARKVPGFGGVYLCGPQGEPGGDFLCICLADPAQKDAAEREVKAWQPGLLDNREVKVVQCKYNFAQLKEWYDRMQYDPTHGIWKVEGITSTDIDEVRNRIVIGVDPEKFEKAAAQLEI